MTDREFQIAFAPMIAHVGKQPTTEQLRYWHEMLDDIDADTVRRAIVTTLRDYQYAGFPPVGIVRKNCGATSGSLTHQDRATIAWAAVKAAVATHGGYATVAFDDPITTAAIRSLGGWPRICDTEAGEAFDVWLKKDFERTFAALMNAGVAAEQTKPLAGLCDISNGATGHEERVPVRLVETGLPAAPKHLVRGEVARPALAVQPAVRRLAETMAESSRSIDVPEKPPREPSRSADEQRRSLAEWQASRV